MTRVIVLALHMKIATCLTSIQAWSVPGARFVKFKDQRAQLTARWTGALGGSHPRHWNALPG
jgi:hypothetical protein